MRNSNANFSLIYYALQIISLVILCLPTHLKMAVYTPNIFGYIWLFTYPLILIGFIFLSIYDIKNGNKKSLRNRGIMFIAFISVTVGLWYFLVYLFK